VRNHLPSVAARTFGDVACMHRVRRRHARRGCGLWVAHGAATSALYRLQKFPNKWIDMVRGTLFRTGYKNFRINGSTYIVCGTLFKNNFNIIRMKIYPRSQSANHTLEGVVRSHPSHTYQQTTRHGSWVPPHVVARCRLTLAHATPPDLRRPCPSVASGSRWVYALLAGALAC
jgi:hypothetical protein